MGKRTVSVMAAPHIMHYYNNHDVTSQRQITTENRNTVDSIRHVEGQREMGKWTSMRSWRQFLSVGPSSLSFGVCDSVG